jgi:hypothetical protein
MSTPETNDEQTEQTGSKRGTKSQRGSTSRGNRPQPQSDSDALKQAKGDALSPDEKHENYLADIERLHRESSQG